MTNVKTKGRNEAIECCRLLASVMVVFIHCHFPGKFGDCMNCLARAAVPFFFMVSGYFAYGADVSVMGRRVVSAAKLNLTATGLFALWGIYKVCCIDFGNPGQWLAWVLSPKSLSGWLIVNVNPFAGHLWYLSALLSILCVMYLYVRWKAGQREYGPLYMVGFLLGLLQILLDSMAKAVGFDVPYILRRNALVLGFPMFCLGLFLREYRDRILAVYGLTKAKLLLVILAGAGLSVLQWFGMGSAEMPVGTYVEVIALLLLLVSVPQVSGGRKWLAAAIGKFGMLSTWIYVTHLLWLEMYEICLQRAAFSFWGGERLEAWLRPVLIVSVSLLSGIVWLGLRSAVKMIPGKGKPRQ